MSTVVASPLRILPQVQSHVAPTCSPGFPVALICMPWGSISQPAPALGILKQCVKRAGCVLHVHYLNVRFAKLLGVQLYSRISAGPHVLPEWFFSPALFGHLGSGEIRNGWEDITSIPTLADMVSELTDLAGGSEAPRLRIPILSDVRSPPP